MRAPLLVALALVGSPCLADAPAPRMTGERLLKLLDPVAPATIPLNPESKLSRDELASLHTMRNVEFVQGYLAALYDETEGKAWCYNAKYKIPKPDAFWDESRWGLHRLAAADLKRNAANLLIEIWHQKWPCPSSQPRNPK